MTRLMTTGLWLSASIIPSLSQACTVCMGDPEAPMTKGMIAGIGVLLLVTACVLASFGSFFIYLMKRASRMNHVSGVTEAG
jgi:hypothetical protein